jgi:ABC-type transport system involved in multi-copper enzyme maturation permease subunit
MLALSLLAFVLSVAFAKIHYSFGAVGDNFGVVYPRGVAMREFITGFALSWIPLVALVAYGLLVSTIVRTPGAAVAVGISALAIIDFTKHLLGLDPYIFTRYIIYPWSTLQQLSQGMDYQWQTDVGKMILLSAVSAVVTFGIGLTIFVREDLNH